jgi:hypothetical protein
MFRSQISNLCLDVSLQPLRGRSLLVATMYKLFSFGDVVTKILCALVLLGGWTCIAPFWVIEFENTVEILAGDCFLCV